MYTTSAEAYDLIYGRLKNYRREADDVAALIQASNPNTHSVLDVGCGTGEHARHLAAHGFIVDGVDLNPRFLRLAQQKHPAGRFVVGDMRRFELPHRYDAVVCLFSAIGYIRTLEEVVQTLHRLRAHCRPGGVVIVEPWLMPGQLDPARVVRNVGAGDGMQVSRIARVELNGRASRLVFDYEITDASGRHRHREIHELMLYTKHEMLDAFRQAGLDAEYREARFSTRGLYVATVPA